MADREEISSSEDNEAEEESEGDICDLEGQGLTCVQIPDGADPKTLILDNNNITKMEHLEMCSRLSQLSAINNHIVRMSGLEASSTLTVLSLSNNSIISIEGLDKLQQLTWLDLSSNSIKCIEHLPTEGKLHYIDLSDNEITLISDLVHLKELKTLLLHSNNIASLKSAPHNLPQGLTVLSLADNRLCDLNEVCYLNGLESLQQLSIADNPCVLDTQDNQYPFVFVSKPLLISLHVHTSFDYRPFVWNWCPGLAILDGFVVTEKERLLGEWLYSQGKGRHFHPGQHVQLVEHLAVTCPLTGSDTVSTCPETLLHRSKY
ncbi:centrosomal protein 97 [Plakobranchus ocellatus]|uniref:Centrosomal protein of 97 kDa n=1 Tax=Plakobranchus ocellatus TaxID=259542 RepID=A0AAV4A8I1_9GAST|nr:centrosomal protein 97 [Plakobranchus ocellatus]